MCGIFGWLGQGLDCAAASAMRDVLYHRGPDDAGQWHDADANVWLGHRRLAIMDLSHAGHQPMLSASGRYVIVFNGEVFNFTELRKELEQRGCTFRGHSDTEVMLAALEVWGLEYALERFVGMFAFALYDRWENVLWLVRDRLGIKPLYYAVKDGELAFSSELSALRGLPWLDQTLDMDALAAYFRYLCVPAPATILRGARKLSAGTLLRWDGKEATLRCYWDVRSVMRAGRAQPLQCSFAEAADELDVRLRRAVAMRMESDVPLGAFLSGGVDSSLVTALMQAESSRPVRTFCIGFAEKSHDESPYARAVARYLGTDHYEHRLLPNELLTLVPQAGTAYDEPFADSSSLPSYLLSRFAREHVTVALSGDGGDELYGGYPRYFWAGRIERAKGLLGPMLVHGLGRTLQRSPAWIWDSVLAPLGRRRLAGADGLATRVSRLGGYLVSSSEEVYQRMVAVWQPPPLLAPEAVELGPDLAKFPEGSWAERMMAVDQANFLPDDILTKMDRASMAVSLEVRVPLLDHSLVEWSWRVPTVYKFSGQGDRGKLLLREVLYRYVPRELIERPKMGFGMPLAGWLRQELRPWVEDSLAPASLQHSGMLDVNAVRNVWRDHLEGKDRLSQLWTVLMFQQWLANWSRVGSSPINLAGSGAV